MGFVESWHFCLYKMCWNTSKFGCSYLQSEKCKFRFMDTTSSRGNASMNNIVLSELWLYDNEIIHTRGGIIAPQVPSLRGTRGAIIPPQVWIISLSYNQS